MTRQRNRKETPMTATTTTTSLARFNLPIKIHTPHLLRRSAVRAVLLAVMIASIAGPALGYNSEEHKVLTDMGVAAVVVPAGIELPWPTRFDLFDLDFHQGPYINAKNLAVGFATNNPADYDENKKKVQDNSYWYGYGQLEYNKKLWIPSPQAQMFRQRGLWVAANARDGNNDGELRTFTLGALVALYGDYRRTTYCEEGRCSLTNADVTTLSFLHGQDCFGIWPFQECGFRPNPVAMETYLRHIGSGLVPPFGSAGNASGNTAADGEIHEAGWWGDEMLRIANVNDWHFSNGAVAWYVGMHRLALIYAEMARSDPRHWNQALHYEASALHSLTDLFAFGHIVTSRAETSRGIMVSEGLETEAAYRWMQDVTEMGGGENDGDGRVELSSLPPTIADGGYHPRNEFLPSYAGTWAPRALREKHHHDDFNSTGATVRNLAGNRFRIFGDGQLKLRSGQPEDQKAMAIIAEAVRVSVQSLFNAYADLDCGARTIDEIGSQGSSYFDALKLVPIFVENDPEDYFNGRWTSYAQHIDNLTEAAVVPANWQACEMDYVDGGIASLPWSDPNSCTTFPSVQLQVPADDFEPACSANSSWSVTETVRDASDWLNQNPTAEVYAFDEFSPGIANGTGCLEEQALELQLVGGAMTITPTGSCAISDSSTVPAVSDVPLQTFQYITLDFDPPIEAFYANFGSVQHGERVRLWLNPDDSDFRALETAPSPDDVFAFGHGFISDRPVSRIIVQGTGLDTSTLGAFVGLVSGEPSLAQVGPSNQYEGDFAVVFSTDELFSDGLESGDTSAWSSVNN